MAHTGPMSELKFSEDHGTNNRMNTVLATIGNHPDGISFNELADKVKEQAARSTLKKWLNIFEEYKVIERNTVRRGQRQIIKTADQCKKWLPLQEVYALEIGAIKEKVAELKEASERRKFNLMDFYNVYKFQTEMTEIPFDSYLAGLKYSGRVASLLRDTAAGALEPLYWELGKIVTEQASRCGFDYQEIFENIHAIMVAAPYLELFKGRGKGRRNLGSLRMSVNTARQKLQNAF